MSAVPTRRMKEGHGSAERPLAKDVLKTDSLQSHPVVAEQGSFVPEEVKFSFERYYDRDYAEREYRKIFLKTWLLAAREEEIPNVGDRIPFNVGPGSFLIVRSAPDQFKAFFNACRHRGAMLCLKKESGESIRCPVHGWEWKIDGDLKNIPSWWDFQGLTRVQSTLREVRVSRWGGCIFINADPDAPSLEEELGPIPTHFKGFDIENRYTAIRLRKLIRANWKAGQEPFQEAYHVTSTHGPFAASLVGDTQAYYDIFKTGPNQVGVGRNIANSGIPSMNAGPEANTVAAANIWIHAMIEFLYPGEAPFEVDPSKDTRKQMADWHRAMQLKHYNRKVELPDTAMVDVVVYFLFPNTFLHLSEMLPYIFQFTPHPNDPQLCYMDLRVLLPYRAGDARPPAAAPIELGADQQVPEHAPRLGFQAHVLQQDIDNMERIQRGARAADPRAHYQHLALYQEMIVRHWHSTYDQYMAR